MILYLHRGINYDTQIIENMIWIHIVSCPILKLWEKKKNTWNLPYPSHLSHIWASQCDPFTKSHQIVWVIKIWEFTNIRIKYKQNVRGEGHLVLIHKKKWHKSKTFLPCDLWQLKYWLTQLKYSLLICDILFYNTIFAYSHIPYFVRLRIKL